ncbi:MAG: prepilin-type N-terminal cleavage/methylation domain-containing protein [Thalassolituus sp.]|jgi:type IV fimbrial biogenesis protein FimT
MKGIESGFTLIELVVTVAVAGILLTVGVPSIKTFITNTDGMAASKLLELDIIYAHDHAKTQAVDVCLTPINENTFDDGWTIQEFESTCSDPGAVGGDIIRERGSLTSGTSAASTTFKKSTPIAFSTEGRAIVSGIITIRTGDCTGNRNVDLEIYISGQVVSSEVSC